MKTNSVSLEDIIEYVDTHPIESSKKSAKKETKIQNQEYDSSLKWGDDAVGLNDDDTETKTKPSPWLSAAKKTPTPSPIEKSKSVDVSFYQPAKKVQSSDSIKVIYEVDEFVACIKNKEKMYVDYVIDDDAHCFHSYNGTLCPNVRECGKIHVQRCKFNMNCTNKKCPFLHQSDMNDETAEQNFINTMDKYNYIRQKK